MSSSNDILAAVTVSTVVIIELTELFYSLPGWTDLEIEDFIKLLSTT